MNLLAKTLLLLTAPALLTACVIDETYSTDYYGQGYYAAPPPPAYYGPYPRRHRSYGYEAAPASGYSTPSGRWGNGYSAEPAEGYSTQSGSGYSADPASGYSTGPSSGYSASPANYSAPTPEPVPVTAQPAPKSNVIPIAAPPGIGDTPAKPATKMIVQPKVNKDWSADKNEEEDDKPVTSSTGFSAAPAKPAG